MQQLKYSFSPFQLNFYDKAIERRFFNQYRVKQLDRIQAGFGFLVLLFMAVAMAQLMLFHAPLLANLSNAGLGVTALIGFSLFNPRRVINRPTWLRWVLAIGISVGSVAVTYLSSISVALQISAASIVLIWLSWFSGLSFRQVSWIVLGVLLPSVVLLVAVNWPLSTDQRVVLTVLGLSTVFACLGSYLSEFIARIDYRQQAQSSSGEHGSIVIEQDQGLENLRTLTVALSGIRDSDAAYCKLLATIERMVPFDLAAIGRLQNERMIPVMIRSGSKEEAGCEDTGKLLWQSDLIDQLQKQHAPLVGTAEMGLLQSAIENGEITFGYRLDVPFFRQQKLEGVITLLRLTPDFLNSESALAASMVFHGLFARRSAHLHQQLEQLTQSRSLKPAAFSGKLSDHTIFGVDAFL